MMTPYLTTIELCKENMKFSAGHTTIFSATEREPLHGHLYTVYLALDAWVDENGMTFDYRHYKKKVLNLCRNLNQTFLMPLYSPYLLIEENEQYIYFTFNQKKIPFLKEDVTILPVTNITVEELSRWFVTRLVEDQDALAHHRIEKILVKIFSGPGQGASHTWQSTP